MVFAISYSSPTDPSVGTKPLDGPNRHRFIDQGVRAATGRGQDDGVREVHRQLCVLHGRVQGDQPVCGDAECPTVYVWHEELSAQTWRERVPKSGGTGAEPGMSLRWPCVKHLGLE